MAGLAGGAGDPAAFQAGPQEVYLLTGAEQTTGVYSNRFAAHIIRQHQFNALCVARGWRNKLRLMVDDAYPPATREMPRGDCGRSSGSKASVRTTERTRPRRNLPVPGHGPGPLLPDGSSGELRSRGRRRVLRRLVRAGSLAELDLEEISPLVFSEIMRDVDLFVGVASVGNDPTWSDGGRRAASGITGRATRSGTSPRCQDAQAGSGAPDPSLEDSGPRRLTTKRFLVVEGDVRTYKIHLGSGNILMEPNDQYLCIVPARGMGSGGPRARCSCRSKAMAPWR